MDLRDLLRETWFSLAANKARSFLTILGIVIGIASVIAMTSLVGGMQNMLLGEFGLYQARMIMIQPMMEPLSEDDLEALRQQFPEYDLLTVSNSASARLSVTDKSTDQRIMGIDENYPAILNIKLEQGRLFTADDMKRSTRVLILGRGVVKELFGSEDADCLGKTVYVGPNRESYTIVGVVEGSGMSETYNVVVAPYTTVQARISGVSGFDSIYGLANDSVDVPDLVVRTTDFLNRRMGYDDLEADEIGGVYVYSMQELLEQLNMLMAGFSLMLTAIASISLFVGGIGIMNMMLTTVTERTREIGLRKSLGAHTSDIVKQFLAESIALCVLGGVLGIVFGYLGALSLAGIISLVQPDMDFAPAIGVTSVSVAVGVSALIGIIFGFYPARRAARLDPVESLRYQ
ncbi:MAG: ABC transporter permease [Coriobacteriales bacterium]|jgi:putative ABC transport system permease protein|nr:ABC transporter permease [Coriobacteriales bacterium]